MRKDIQTTNRFNADARRPPEPPAAQQRPVVYADNAFEFKSLSETVGRINAATGANTLVRLREPAFRPGAYGC